MNLSDENKSGNEIGNIHCVQANSEEERVVFSNEAQNGFSWFRMVGIAFVAVVGFTNLAKEESNLVVGWEEFSISDFQFPINSKSLTQCCVLNSTFTL